jgi:NTE family protein
VRLPWDYVDYGRAADDERVIDAVQASMSIPFYFRPVKLRTEGGAVTWVDGGLLVNFPITTFDRTDCLPPRWPTWGVKVSSSPKWSADRPVQGPVRMGVRCLQTLTSDWYRSWLAEDGAGRRTIQVDTSGVSSTDFNLDVRTRDKLFESGRQAATAFLERLG